MRDSHFCKICYATVFGKDNFRAHMLAHKNKTIPVENKPVDLKAAPAEKVAEKVTTAPENIETIKKYTKEELVAMNKKQVMEIAENLGIHKIEGKYLSACKVGDIEDAVISAN